MDNEALKQVFRNLHTKITKTINPDSVIDELFSNHVISDNDNCNLYNVPDPTSRCRKLFALLHLSSHPETFIRLRVALLDEYPSIVAEIDEQLASLTAQQPPQHPLDQPTKGNFLYPSKSKWFD